MTGTPLTKEEVLLWREDLHVRIARKAVADTSSDPSAIFAPEEVLEVMHCLREQRRLWNRCYPPPLELEPAEL
jgi:hypothetical protein